MRYLFFFMMMICSGLATVQAQDSTAVAASDSTQITDEDLKKYAVTMDSINDMKNSLLSELTAMLKSNTKMTGARYNELSKIVDDEARLKAAKATPEEIAFVRKVAERKAQGTQEINDTFQALAKDYVGSQKYNDIKKALANDPTVKAKYDAILDEVKNGHAD
jgi:hypothetical protein